ncbi:hypothetical protein D3C72_991510 [compost metagenome]
MQRQRRQRQRAAGRAQQEMAVALAGAVGVARDQDQADRAHGIGYHRIQADRHHVGDAEVADHQRHPEAQRQRTTGQRKIDKREQVHARVAQNLPQRVQRMAAGMCLRGRVARQVGTFAVGQPAGLLRAINKAARGQQAQQHRGRALDRKHPLPALQPEHPGHVAHDPAGHQPAQHTRHRHAGEEDRHHRGAAARREPVGQVEHDAGEEAGFEHAQQEAQRIELRRGGDAHHRHRGQAPQHHDARERAPCAKARQQHVAGHFAQHVADVEDRGAQAVHGVAEAQVLLHLQLGEADVDAVQERHHVADEQERDDAQPDLAVERILIVRSQCCGRQGGGRQAG